MGGQLKACATLLHLAQTVSKTPGILTTAAITNDVTSIASTTGYTFITFDYSLTPQVLHNNVIIHYSLRMFLLLVVGWPLKRWIV